MKLEYVDLPTSGDGSADAHASLAGSFVSAAGAPFSQHALPPSDLDTPLDIPDYLDDYHMYEVMEPLTIVGGPITIGGAQFYVGATGNIRSLVANGYLKEIKT